MDTPSTIGRYHIKRWVASGAMGDVYEAHDPAIERQIALKVLRRELTERGDAKGWLERFRQEARAAGRLLHPNIVTLLDYGEQDGIPFLAMEYVEGESLDAVLKRSGRLAYAEAIAVVMQMLGALDFAHANRIVHRDIKPSNVLLTKAGLVKIADFGIAHIEASELTTAGDVLGTPSYMAPEQLAGSTVDHRADQFAAAAVLFELLSGVKPFQGKSLAESMLNMETRGPTDLCTLNPQITPALRGVIETALAFAPERRYPSATELSQAIATAAALPDRPAIVRLSREDTLFAPATQIRPPPQQPTKGSLGAELLAEVERDLTTFIGPLAKIAVRRCATTIDDVEGLYQTLARYIENESERDSFLAKGRRRASLFVASSGDGSGKPRVNRSPVRPSPAILVSPDTLNRIEATLTEYIGPIAPMLLRQLLSKSSSLADFYQDVAAYIPDERDRAEFLRSRQGP